MTARRVATIGLWLAVVAVCVVLIARTGLSTDMSAFLPRSPSAAQEVLVDQVRNGVVSRLILVGLEGAPPETLAALSKALAERLRASPAFAAVNNGEDLALAGERDWLWSNRYLLSPKVTPERFTVSGLRSALENDLQLLRSELAPLVKSSLRNDPTGEILVLIDRLAGTTRPHGRDGVWFSRDERRAILVAQTRAAGFDIDAQEQALGLIDDAFAAARRGVSGADQARLLLTGPGVFAVHSRATMKADATRLSMLATAMVAALLLFAYRSPATLLLGLLPVVTGALAGFAAVALGFGFVHGITLGFGVTLIGESVDYAVYLFTQTEPGGALDGTLARIWPTLRLGALTSVAGFSAMLFSGFTGFAQLGLFSIGGLVAALATTRWLLPALVAHRFATVEPRFLAAPLLLVIGRARLLLPAAALLVAVAGVLLCFHRGGFWQEDLSSLSPIPSADQRLDQELRRDIGAPDVRYLIVADAADRERALAASETLSGALEPLVAQKQLAGFDAPDEYLPSEPLQHARQDALPDAETLRERLKTALDGLPFRADAFAPFIEDVSAAKRLPLLTRDRLPANLASKLDALLFAREGRWIAVLSLRGVSDPQGVADAIAKLNAPGVAFVDLKTESDRLLQTYQREAVTLASVGSLVVLALLFVSLRSLRRVLVVAVPLAAAVLLTAALLTAGGGKLSIFNLVGLLLIVAVGSNYCLFFERQGRDPNHRDRSVASLVLANLCTVLAFGLLSLSGIPVLHDIGVTVAVGTLLSLVLAAILSGYGEAHGAAAVADSDRRPAG